MIALDLSIDAKLGELGSEVQFWKVSQNFGAVLKCFNGFGQQFLGIILAAHRPAQNLDALTPQGGLNIIRHMDCCPAELCGDTAEFRPVGLIPTQACRPSILSG